MKYQILFFLILFFSFMSFGQTTKYSFKDTITAKNLLLDANDLISKQELNKALVASQKARKIYKSVVGSNSKEVSECWYAEVKISFFKRDQDAMKTALDSVLAIQLNVFGNSSVEVAGSYNGLGIYHLNNGNYFEAANSINMALEIIKKKLGDKHENVAAAYNNLGIIYKNQGKSKKAIIHYEKALNIWLPILGKEHANIGSIYQNLGIAYLNQNEFEKAIFYFEKTIDLRLKIYGEDHALTGDAYNTIGIAFAGKKEFEKAEANYRHGLKIWKTSLGEEHQQIAEAYNNLGNLYKEQHSFDLANSNFEKGIKILTTKFGRIHPEIAGTYKNMAFSSFVKGDYKKAIFQLEKASYALNFSTIDSLQMVTSLPYLGEIMLSLSKAHFEKFKLSDDEKDFAVSKDYIEKAIRVFDFQSQQEGKVDSKLLSENSLPLFEHALILSKASSQKSESRNSFSYSERAKFFFLLNAIQDSEALSFSRIPESLIKKERELKSFLAYQDKKKRELLLNGEIETDSSVLEISGKIFDIDQEYFAFKNKLENDYPEYFRLKYDLSTVSVEEVQKDLITTEQTLLEYFVGDSSIFVFVINKNDYQVHEIKKDFPLEEWVKTFRKSNQNNKFASMTSEYTKIAHELYRKIVAPVASDLKEEVIIVPDGVLGYIPFEALLVKPVTKINRWKTHHYLLKDKQISYCYSATLLREMREKKHRKEAEKGLLSFAPFYDGDTTLLAGLFRYAEEEDKKPLKPLPSSGEEVYGIQKIMGGDVYYQEEATEDNFTTHAGDYRFLHLATHGKANDKVGDYSYLAFTEQKDSFENELLYVRDLYNIQLNTDMVVLSACETGIGELQKGEGIISLARGFTYAGAKSIITTLWSVEDERSKDLMISFYKNLKKGMSKDSALRQAKLDFIDSVGTKYSLAHPFYWSGFIGIGDMRPLGFN